MKTVYEAIETRYSARYFDKNKQINNEDFMKIINAGLKAPSGFNSQPWKFIRIKGDRHKIYDSIQQQQAVLDSSEFIVMLYVKEKYLENNSSFFSQFEKMNVSKEKIELYKNAAKDKVKTNYFKEQTLFAASQMVLQAAALDIDSLIIGGFNEESLLNDLKLDANTYGISVCIAFGYNLNEAKKREHRLLDEVLIDITL